jgi:hypothetical protein
MYKVLKYKIRPNKFFITSIKVFYIKKVYRLTAAAGTNLAGLFGNYHFMCFILNRIFYCNGSFSKIVHVS